MNDTRKSFVVHEFRLAYVVPVVGFKVSSRLRLRYPRDHTHPGFVDRTDDGGSVRPPDSIGSPSSPVVDL